MQSAGFIALMDRVGGMAFITLLQEIPRGAGGTPEDHQVLCISDQCLRHAWNLRSSGPPSAAGERLPRFHRGLSVQSRRLRSWLQRQEAREFA